MARPRPKVLVVDDDAATRDGLTALLESWGYHALAVANGQAALQRCNQDLPHADCERPHDAWHERASVYRGLT
jgi:CheY-like chemotaxis protein